MEEEASEEVVEEVVAAVEAGAFEEAGEASEVVKRSQ